MEATRMQLRSGTIVGQNFLPPQNRPLFEEGARLLFAKWTALQLAVANQWGGTNSAEKAELLLRDCLEWFYRKRGKGRRSRDSCCASSVTSPLSHAIVG